MDFKELGLTENEAKAYETLLRLGKTSAALISKESKVPYGRIYNVLESLEEKGLARTIPEKTRKYAPSDPSQLHLFISEKKKLLEEAEKKISEYKTLYSEHGKNSVQVVTGKNNFYKLIRQLDQSKHYEYSIKYNFDTHPEFIRNTKTKKSRKVDYKVLGRIDAETKKNVEFWKKIHPAIKPIKNDGVAVSIVDDKDVFIALIKSNATILIKDEPFAALMKELFLCYYEHH